MTEKELKDRFKLKVETDLTLVNSVKIHKGFNLKQLTHAQFPAAAIDIGHAIHDMQNPYLVGQDINLTIAVRDWKTIYGDDARDELLAVKVQIMENLRVIYGLNNEASDDLQQCFITYNDALPMQDVLREGGRVYFQTFLFYAEYDSTP